MGWRFREIGGDSRLMIRAVVLAYIIKEIQNTSHLTLRQ